MLWIEIRYVKARAVDPPGHLASDGSLLTFAAGRRGVGGAYDPAFLGGVFLAGVP
jgi:hypothetical protein